ncbi:hypothetical protein SNOG_15882 [Parastagonospora nodorum SN15]|uniref:Uncharacterized protein n=1 Tax=Phaeosphaeria nodorum (strain SN15 / ATCC MYA-4574 / FGSC 10173) TaxID=321614 RepID=Q0TX59_PHANO|nr:hypothetical protein SNOG_15882 [Parastagonospora nodorum SN15]EAT76720.1 hypothetical protein SNOG_15882 [Parastagonospora nodorum SN15]
MSSKGNSMWDKQKNDSVRQQNRIITWLRSTKEPALLQTRASLLINARFNSSSVNNLKTIYIGVPRWDGAT